MSLTDRISESHISIRFAVYARFLVMLWTLCKCFNPARFPEALPEFLHLLDEELDIGYSSKLQKEALATGSIPLEIKYMESEKAQKELEQAVGKAKSCSLDVERLISQHRKLETVKVSGLGIASRNAIIKTHQVERNRQVKHKLKHDSQAAGQKYMSCRAVARQERPDLAVRARGTLWWQNDVSEVDQRRISFSGDQERYKAWLQENEA